MKKSYLLFVDNKHITSIQATPWWYTAGSGYHRQCCQSNTSSVNRNRIYWRLLILSRLALNVMRKSLGDYLAHISVVYKKKNSRQSRKKGTRFEQRYVEHRRQSVAFDGRIENLGLPRRSEQEVQIESLFHLLVIDRLPDGVVDCRTSLHLVYRRSTAIESQWNRPQRHQFDYHKIAEHRDRTSQLHLGPHRSPRHVLRCQSDGQLDPVVGHVGLDRREP